MSCPDILEALLVAWAKWQQRVSLFLNANWTSGVHKGKKANLTSRLAAAECIFYELADPLQRRLKPAVVMFMRCRGTSCQKSLKLYFNEINKLLKK